MTRGAPARVLYVEINEDHTTGGSHQCLYDLVSHLDQTRFRPLVLFYQDNQVAERMRAEGIAVIAWDRERSLEGAVPGRLAQLRLAGRQAAAVWRRVHLLMREHIDLVHLNNSPSVTFQDWLPAARLLGRPCITHARGNVFRPKRRWQRTLIGGYDRVLPISRAMEIDVQLAGIAQDRITVVHDGIDLGAWRARARRSPSVIRAELGVSADRLMVVAVGHLKPWKGQRQVLDALQRLPARTREQIMVLFAGTASPLEAAYRAELEQVIASRALAGSVRLLGARDDVPDLMRAADVVLHSSIAPEPFGLVVVEAMALGVPVVASSLGGPAEIVTPGTGLLVDPRDVEALASALARMAGDAVFRASLAAAGRVRADDFAVERTVAAIEAVYDELLARP